jgi:hypothetical protein
MRPKKAKPQILRIRLSVREVKPEIWRLVLVSSDITLARLHGILQILMGWQNYHLYAFEIEGSRYTPPHEDDDNFGRGKSIRTKLSSIFAKSTKTITYEYDFGDGWEIELSLDSVLDITRQKRSAECIGGARHGPAEDSGGPHGFMEKVKIWNNSKHKRYQQTRDWIGADFDPEKFDINETNEMLNEIE